jgi:putative membrane protein
MEIIEQSILGILPFLIHLGAALLLLAAFMFVYAKITPYPELELIRSGNVAAACSLSGATMGFAIPLAQATAQSGNLLDMLMWSAIALVVQLLAYVIVRLLIPNLARDITENRVSAGLFLGAIALTTGILNAASMSDG